MSSERRTAADTQAATNLARRDQARRGAVQRPRKGKPEAGEIEQLRAEVGAHKDALQSERAGREDEDTGSHGTSNMTRSEIVENLMFERAEVQRLELIVDRQWRELALS